MITRIHLGGLEKFLLNPEKVSAVIFWFDHGDFPLAEHFFLGRKIHPYSYHVEIDEEGWLQASVTEKHSLFYDGFLAILDPKHAGDETDVADFMASLRAHPRIEIIETKHKPTEKSAL